MNVKRGARHGNVPRIIDRSDQTGRMAQMLRGTFARAELRHSVLFRRQTLYRR
jgi:hypothetical protein